MNISGTLFKTLRWVLYTAGIAVVLILILAAVLALVPIPIDLTKHKALLEDEATKAIGRSFSIDDTVQLTTSLWPELIIKGLHIGNPPNFKNGDFARMHEARIRIGIVPLLSRKIHVQGFAVEGLSLFLMSDENDNVNWTFSPPEAVPEKKSVEADAGQQKRPVEISSDALALESISLNEISLSYITPESVGPLEFTINKCSGSARVGKPMKLFMDGSFLGESFTTSLSAASLQEMIEHNRSWMEIETEVANARFNLAGSVDLSRILQELRMSISVDGKELESFNQLLGLDLPPVPTYGATASFHLSGNRLDLSDFRVYIADSELTGTLSAMDEGGRPMVDIDLNSPRIQINDFIFEDWSAGRDIEDTKSLPDNNNSLISSSNKQEYKVEAEGVQSAVEARKLISPEFLESFDARLSVTAESVLSGTDQLGNGHVTVAVQNGRVTVDPLDLAIPGGSMFIALSLKPGREMSEAAVKAKMENFDFGIMARRVEPETNMGGRINLDIDLKSSANDPGDLLPNGKGYFDFSAHPENLRAGIIDLWAVNLISWIVSNADKDQSQIECLVGRWSMNDGLLKPDVFVIDTTRMRICGQGTVDFKKETVDLKVAPAPKKPQFFSLATPLAVQGSFTDFEVGVVKGGIAGTSLSFITSPIHVPVRRLFGKPVPEDGSDVCGMPLGAQDRPEAKPRGCR